MRIKSMFSTFDYKKIQHLFSREISKKKIIKNKNIKGHLVTNPVQKFSFI